MSDNPHGFTWHQRDDGIFVYHFDDMRRTTIDAWMQASLSNDYQAVEQQQHIRSIIDLRNAGWPTPYALNQVVKAAQSTPSDLRESIAVLVKDAIGYRMAELALKRFDRKLQHASRLFRDENAALAWLQERQAILGE